MRTLDDAINEFAYHPATKDTVEKHSNLRDLAIEFAKDTWDLVPDGPNKTLAYRGLQTFLMHAQCAVAMTAPADLSETRAVARVLPDAGEEREESWKDPNYDPGMDQ